MSSPLTLREESKKGAEGTGGGVYLKHGEQGQGEIYVQGLSEFCVKDVQETLLLLGTAERNRKIRETAMNLFSSRSHSIFQVGAAAAGRRCDAMSDKMWASIVHHPDALPMH